MISYTVQPGLPEHELSEHQLSEPSIIQTLEPSEHADQSSNIGHDIDACAHAQ